MKFGKIYGRFFLKQHLDQPDDDTPDLCTISELIETYPMWSQWIQQVPEKKVQLYTMFETSDVHPDIIEQMKLFERVIVPFDYLKDILVKHGVNCEAVNWYTSPLVTARPATIQKEKIWKRLYSSMWVQMTFAKIRSIWLILLRKPLKGQNTFLL